MKLTALTIQLDGVYWVVSLHQTCKTLFLQMSHLKSFPAENISFFYFFVLFLSFCLLKSPHGLSNVYQKVFPVERHSEVFLLINLCDTIYEQDF